MCMQYTTLVLCALLLLLVFAGKTVCVGAHAHDCVCVCVHEFAETRLQEQRLVSFRHSMQTEQESGRMEIELIVKRVYVNNSYCSFIGNIASA